ADSPLLLAGRALQTRDRAAADLPYLARWFCRPLPASVPRASRNEADEFINGPVLRAIAAATTLGEIIADVTLAADETLPFVDPADDAEDAVTALRDAFQRDQDRLLDPLNQDVETLRGIDEMLQLPILPWSKRLAMLQKRASLQDTLHKSAIDAREAADSTLADSPPETASTKFTYAERSAGWKRHPLLAILQLDAHDHEDQGKNTARQAIARVGEDVRRRLNELVYLSEEDGQAEQSRVKNIRAVLSTPADAARVSAAIWPPISEGDPIAELRRFDWQELLLHHGRRSLDDFLGPIQSKDKPGQPTPFFDTAASGYLEAAEAVRPLRGEMQQWATSLRRELSRRRVAARRGLQITAEPDVQLDSTDNVAASVTVASGMESDSNEGNPPLFSGLGTLFLRSPRGTVSGARATVQLPVSLDGESRGLRGKPASASDRVYEAIAFFRGHEFTAPLLIEGLGGV
ncbi:MAG: hypothetical protein WD070_10625, partial [Pirellulaceae bacterium]